MKEAGSIENGFKSHWSLDFFRLLLSNCLNWKIYCDDPSSLWSTTAVQIYELFHIYFTLDTDSFLNALRPFIARRGKPVLVRTDNGSNFVSGDKEICANILQWNTQRNTCSSKMFTGCSILPLDHTMAVSGSGASASWMPYCKSKFLAMNPWWLSCVR